MRVSQISVYHQPQNYRTLPKRQACPPECPQPLETNFKGKFGAWVGGVLGAAAVVTTAILAAPSIVCLAGGGAIVGAIGGHVAEDAVNGTDDSNKQD